MTKRAKLLHRITREGRLTWLTVAAPVPAATVIISRLRRHSGIERGALDPP